MPEGANLESVFSRHEGDDECVVAGAGCVGLAVDQQGRSAFMSTGMGA